jgi:hypothetical protein
MQRYLLSESVTQLLDSHKGIFPTKRGFQAYIKQVLRARFSSDFYSDARNGRPTQRLFLVNLLLYLRDQEGEFIKERLGEDWQEWSVEKLTSRHIRQASEEHEQRPKKNADAFRLNPTCIAAEMFSRIHDDGPCRPATMNDIETLVHQFALGVGDAFNPDHLPPVKESVEEGFRRTSFDSHMMATFLRNAIQYCGNSVWIRPHVTDPLKTLFTITLPVSEAVYEQFRQGIIDEAEIVLSAPCKQSDRVIVVAMLGYSRYANWLAKAKAKADLTFMVWRQIGLVTTDALKNGVRILVFQSTEANGKRIRSWGFNNSGNRMKRTGFPIFELPLMPEDNKGLNRLAPSLWSIILVYQAIARARPIEAIHSSVPSSKA